MSSKRKSHPMKILSDCQLFPSHRQPAGLQQNIFRFDADDDNDDDYVDGDDDEHRQPAGLQQNIFRFDDDDDNDDDDYDDDDNVDGNDDEQNIFR